MKDTPVDKALPWTDYTCEGEGPVEADEYITPPPWLNICA